jgi:ATP-binding cassette subfamily B (MDR/TAP) protein 1
MSDGVSESMSMPEAEEVAPPPAASMWRLLKVNKPEWGYGALGCLGSVGSGLMNPAFALVISNVLYAYYFKDFHKMRTEINKYSIIFLCLAGVAVAAYFSQHFFFGVMGENLVKRVREMMFARKFDRSIAALSVFRCPRVSVEL